MNQRTNRFLKYSICICLSWIFLFQPSLGQSSVPLLEKGVSAYISGDPEYCLEYYNMYYSATENLSDKVKHALLMRMAFLAEWNLFPDRAENFLSHADSLEAAGVVPDSVSIADRAISEAIKEFGNSNLTGASELLLKSVQFREEKNEFEQAILATTYGFQAYIYNMLEDYETAVRYYEQAIRIDRELGRFLILAQESSELAAARTSIDPFNPLIDRELEEALAIFQELDSLQDISTVYNEYGALYRKRGDLPRALDYFVKSVRIKEQNKKATNLDGIYNNIGAIYEEMNQTDSAFYYLRMAIDKAKTQKNKTLGHYYNNLGSLFGRLGNYDSALFYIDKAIGEALPGEDIYNDSKRYFKLNPQLSIFLAARATALFQSYEGTGNIKNLEESIDTYIEALDQIDTLRFLNSFESKALTVKEKRKYYCLALRYASEYYEQTNRPEDLENAFLLACRSKGVVFDEYQRVSEAREFLNINPDLIKRDDSLKMI